MKRYKPTSADIAHLEKLVPFLPRNQYRVIYDLLQGEEGAFFAEKLAEYAERVKTMPHTYQQDGKGDKAVVYLHYFYGASDWYITEKDKEGDGTEQAFGFACLNGDMQCAELGYISIAELRTLRFPVELDLHWTPKPLSEAKAELRAKNG